MPESINYPYDNSKIIIFNGSPDGSAGYAIQENWKEFADRIGMSLYNQTTNPSNTNDSTEGFSVGSIWHNVNNSMLFKCIDATEDAAVWIAYGIREAVADTNGDDNITFRDVIGNKEDMRSRALTASTVALARELIALVDSIPTDGDFSVPSIDSSDNTQMSDVVGNKSDTTSGDSIVSLVKLNYDTAVANFNVPAIDSSSNVNTNDVVGNKSDTTSGDSIVSLNKSIIDQVDDGTNHLHEVVQLAKHYSFEIERHVHHYDRWFGAAASASAPGHVADHNSLTPFTVTAGEDVFGSWVQILGEDDTPVVPGKVKFDLNKIMETNVSTDATYILQIAYDDDSSTSGDTVISNYTYSEDMMYVHAGVTKDVIVEVINSRRHDCGATRAWARAMADGSGKSISFFYALHEYEEETLVP
jgi:hypothetical protein